MDTSLNQTLLLIQQPVKIRFHSDKSSFAHYRVNFLRASYLPACKIHHYPAVR